MTTRSPITAAFAATRTAAILMVDVLMCPASPAIAKDGDGNKAQTVVTTKDDPRARTVGNDASKQVVTVASPRVRVVSIDVLPGRSNNAIDLRTMSRGMVPFALLSTDELQAAKDILGNSLGFGALGSEDSVSHCMAGDINKDDRLDLVCWARVAQTGLGRLNTEARILGWAADGARIEGAGAISVRADLQPRTSGR